MNRNKAILLIGPTGAGKTPLGDFCEQEGLWGTKCFHFDFGESLRRIVKTGVTPSLLNEEDIGVIIHSLKSGVLLENENFHIAENILLSFMEDKAMNERDVLLLNGLPRHVGQAKDVDEIVDVKKVVFLDCTPEVVSERIRLNSGGDRSERVDDFSEAVAKKLMLFHERTFPLLNHYREKKVEVEKVNIAVDTTPAKIHRTLIASSSSPCFSFSA